MNRAGCFLFEFGSFPVSGQSRIRQFRRIVNRQKLMKQIRLINLFKSFDSHTEVDIRNEFLSTRIYMILLIIILSFLIEYHSLLVNTIKITISSPSFDTIINMNESSMICPCSTTNIPLKIFTSIKPIFHPICSSDFINEIWLNRINTTNNNDGRNLKIRFRILSLFCELAQQTFESELHYFGNTYLLSTQLISENQFETQINVSIDQTITNARSAFATSLQLVINTTSINTLLSADYTFQPSGALMDISMDYTSWMVSPIRFANVVYRYSNCKLNNLLGNITINEFYTNCDGIQSLLDSSFVSFYNINIIKSLSNLISNVSYHPLNLSIIYSNNATIRSILNTLMLDTYSINISYQSYFNTCHPKTCIYTKKGREDVIDTIIVVIGLIGGLTGILHFIIWYLVRFIERPKTINTDEKSCMNLFVSLRNKFRSLNLFDHSGDLERNEIISTRIFILLFLIILIIFIFYTSLTLTTISVTINRPNYDKFVSLDKQYSSTLICSCSNLTIPYQTFISFKPIFHQICSSTFIDSEFLNLFSNDITDTYVNDRDDLHRFIWPIFNTIQIFCDLSKKRVEEQVKTFLLTRFVSNQVMNEQQFNGVISQIILAMIQTSQQQITIPIKLIRDTTYSNQIISNLLTNVNFENFDLRNSSITNRTIGLTNNRYGSCNCLTSPSCIQPARIVRPGRPIFYLDGFFIGCYIVESVLRSSMECLYSQICIDRTILYAINEVYVYGKFFPYSMNITKNSSYTINTTFSELLNNLMIEKWNPLILHKSYYQSCKPSQCIYSFVTQRDLSYIITILFGIIGGVNRVLRLIVPRFVSILMKFINRNRIIIN